MYRNSADAHQDTRIFDETRGSPKAFVFAPSRAGGPVALEARARW